MRTLRGEAFLLEMQDDGTGVVIEDCIHKTRWQLDETTRLVSRDTERYDNSAYAAEAITQQKSAVFLLGQGKTQYLGDDTILATYGTPAGRAVLRWVMKPDRLHVFADPVKGQGVNAMTLPGTFRPEGENIFLQAIPYGQGILHTGKGPSFYRPHAWGDGSGGFNMAMFGQIAQRSALLVVTETDADAVLHWEKTDNGEVRLMWRQDPSFGRLVYPREVIFFSTLPNLTALCKCYRRYEIEKRRFRSWDEKIAARPKLSQLFGSAIVFLGYSQDPELDYAASFRALKAAGIDKAYVYPIYWNTTLDTTKRLGAPGIDERRLLPLLHELGYMAGSFIYISDGPPGTGDDPWCNHRLDKSGRPRLNWEMNNMQWFVLSTDKRFEWARKFLDREHKGFDGMHCDVLTADRLGEDYHPNHSSDARADKANRETMLRYAAGKGLLVSSEVFCGRMTPYYDLGNTKYPYALGGEEYCIVPMTMLVYHDSAYHIWWEVDNYNNPEHRSQGGRGFAQRFAMGGGSPQAQSAMDALMGTPPDLFPFGKMWNFIPHTKQVYFYRYRLEDPCVQEAITYVKPVMALNAKIGKLEMIEHRLHTPEGAVQETVFADGTRVIANFANIAMEAPEVGLLPAESWVTIKL